MNVTKTRTPNQRRTPARPTHTEWVLTGLLAFATFATVLTVARIALAVWL